MFESITNYYEHLVFHQIQQVMAERDIPLDPDFMADIACIALNHLPPRYVRHAVDVSASLNDPDWDELNTRVTQAVHEAFDRAKRRKTTRQDSSNF